MSGQIARMVRRTTKRELDALKDKDLAIVKAWLKAVCTWPLKDRLLMAYRILFKRFKDGEK